MAALSSKERVKRFMRREAVDVMPVFSGMGMVTVQAIEKVGIRFAQVHSSSRYLAESATASAEIFGFDSVVVPYDMCTIPEAMGRGCSTYEEAEGILYPTVPSKWESLEAVEVASDWIEKARMPIVEDALRRLVSEGRYAVGGWVLGPFTLGGQVLELDALLKATKKAADKVHGFLKQMTSVVIEVARRYQSLGVDYITIREMGSGTDLLSPRMWKQLVQPYLREVFSALASPKVLHICGGTDLIVEMMNECGADALSFDQKNTIQETRRKVGDEVIILGNFDPYGTLCQKDVSEVPGVIKGCIDAGVDAVWPGCDIWPDVKAENVRAWVETVRTYGTRPSPAVGRL